MLAKLICFAFLLVGRATTNKKVKDCDWFTNCAWSERSKTGFSSYRKHPKSWSQLFSHRLPSSNHADASQNKVAKHFVWLVIVHCKCDTFVSFRGRWPSPFIETCFEQKLSKQSLAKFYVQNQWIRLISMEAMFCCLDQLTNPARLCTLSYWLPPNDWDVTLLAVLLLLSSSSSTPTFSTIDVRSIIIFEFN